MPIPDARTTRAVRKAWLATGMGAIFGLQMWRLAVAAPANVVPWYGLVWIFYSQVMLGFGIGVPGAGRWWKRGAAWGLVCGIPSAFGARALGLPWMPYAIAPVVFSIWSGAVMAFLADAFFPPAAISAGGAPSVPEGASAGAVETKTEMCPDTPYPSEPVRKRLAEGNAELEYLDAERELRADPRFGRTTEDRIIWSELIELELQEIDELESRICGGVDERPRGPVPPNQREGGSHERNHT